MATNYTTPDTAETLLSTELNSLANDAGALGSAFSNDGSGEHDLFCTLELYIAAQGSARDTGAFIDVYFLETNDDTNYTDENAPGNNLVASFLLDPSTSARYLVKGNIPLPPVGFKPYIANRTGQSLAASGNTLKMRRYNVEDV